MQDIVAKRVDRLPGYWIAEYRHGMAAGLKDPQSGVSRLLFSDERAPAMRFKDPSKLRVVVIEHRPIRPEDGVQVCYTDGGAPVGPSDFCITMVRDAEAWLVSSDLSEEEE